ncbi:MAG: hypothetical protein LUE27_04345, partial [Clostridia bacterium]|nr:hypothetical protein [Clostridia bacterium]
LEETKAPEGYAVTPYFYLVHISYGEVVEIQAWQSLSDGTVEQVEGETWNGTVVDESIELNIYKYVMYGTDNTASDYYDTALANAKFILYRDNGDDTEYAVISDGKITGWTTDRDEATAVATNEDGLISVSGSSGNGFYAGTTYYIEETEAPDGYLLLEDPYSFSFDETGRVTGDGVITISYGDSEMTVYAVGNPFNPELPYTGGIGTRPFKVGGVLILAFAASCLVYLNRKRRRESS